MLIAACDPGLERRKAVALIDVTHKPAWSNPVARDIRFSAIDSAKVATAKASSA